MICIICRRFDDGIGYAPPRSRNVGEWVWACNDHIKYAKAAYHMSQETFNAIEREALMEAGDAAGGYLDELGKTDLATLTPEEWEAFLMLILKRFPQALADRFDGYMAPF